MKTDWQDQNCTFGKVTERKGIVVRTLVIAGAKNCFGTEHFSLSFLVLQAQEKQTWWFKSINGSIVF